MTERWDVLGTSQAAQLSLRAHCSRHSSGDRGSGRWRRYAWAQHGPHAGHAVAGEKNQRQWCPVKQQMFTI